MKGIKQITFFKGGWTAGGHRFGEERRDGNDLVCRCGKSYHQQQSNPTYCLVVMKMKAMRIKASAFIRQLLKDGDHHLERDIIAAAVKKQITAESVRTALRGQASMKKLWVKR